LVELGAYAIASGFFISFLFLFGKMYFEKRHARSKVFWGSLIGALLIAVTMILSLVTVVGLSVLAGVSLTGFSNMSFVLSVGFAVEYSVHIVQRWLRADLSHESGIDRVKYTMSFLMLPTFMSFVSSTIGVVCLAFTEFEFNQVFFFRPL
jgi:predicted RND superfamily exporter protein